MDIVQYKLKSNLQFSIITEPYKKKQHPNQQGGLDLYVDVLNHYSGKECSVKLYENTKGLHFKFDGTHYLTEFTEDVIYIPYQIIYEKEFEE